MNVNSKFSDKFFGEYNFQKIPLKQTLSFLFSTAVTGYCGYQISTKKLEGSVKVLNLIVGLAGLAGMVNIATRMLYQARQTQSDLSENKVTKNNNHQKSPVPHLIKNQVNDNFKPENKNPINPIQENKNPINLIQESNNPINSKTENKNSILKMGFELVKANFSNPNNSINNNASNENEVKELKKQFFDPKFPFLFSDDTVLLKNFKDIYKEEINRQLIIYHKDAKNVIDEYLIKIKNQIKELDIVNKKGQKFCFTEKNYPFGSKLHEKDIPNTYLSGTIKKLKEFKKQIKSALNSLISMPFKSNKNNELESKLNELIQNSVNYEKAIKLQHNVISSSQFDKRNNWEIQSILFQGFFAKRILKCLPDSKEIYCGYSDQLKSLKKNIQKLKQTCELFKSDAAVWKNCSQTFGKVELEKINSALHKLKCLERIDNHHELKVDVNKNDNKIDFPDYIKDKDCEDPNIWNFFKFWEQLGFNHQRARIDLDKLYKDYQAKTSEYKKLIYMIDLQLNLVDLEKINEDESQFSSEKFSLMAIELPVKNNNMNIVSSIQIEELLDDKEENIKNNNQEVEILKENN
ncbi:MAG: hypothetical protein Q8K60_06140 [Parachlamydiaceae bacterium]|nr:hypothetical protein [Parachlamydiaceae bacterium]